MTSRSVHLAMLLGALALDQAQAQSAGPQAVKYKLPKKTTFQRGWPGQAFWFPARAIYPDGPGEYD